MPFRGRGSPRIPDRRVVVTEGHPVHGQAGLTKLCDQRANSPNEMRLMRRTSSLTSEIKL